MLQGMSFLLWDIEGSQKSVYANGIDLYSRCFTVVQPGGGVPCLAGSAVVDMAGVWKCLQIASFH
jgi:hypothetical protein